MPASFTQTIAGHTLDLDLTKIGAKTKSRKEDLTILCTDIFLIAIRMREAENLGEPAALRKLIIHYINLFKKNCRAIDTQSFLIDDAVYALVALLDETVMSVPGECRNYWVTNPIQLEMFGANMAGEEFFRKLGRLMIKPDQTKEVLEIFYICLSLGFEGKYKLGNQAERDSIIDKLARLLLKAGKRSVAGLSPHGRRSIAKHLLKKKKRGFVPVWVVGILISIMLGAWWGFMFFLTEQSVESVISIIK